MAIYGANDLLAEHAHEYIFLIKYRKRTSRKVYETTELRFRAGLNSVFFFFKVE